MPVTGTSTQGTCENTPGVPGPPVAQVPVPCSGVHILSPTTPGEPVTGKPVLRRTRAVSVSGKQLAVIDWVMRDQHGNPVDLSECLCEIASTSSLSAAECALEVQFRMQEYLTVGGGCTAAVTVVDAAIGHVQATLTPELTATPGVYFGQFALVDVSDSDNEVIHFSNTFYLHVGQNLASAMLSGGAVSGPPSIAEVRLHLRDSGPEESFLLDNLRFSDEEIAHATILPIQYWNEIPPPLDPPMTTQNFPYRYHWLTAIAGYLFRIAAEQYRANSLNYAAGGISIDDQNKEPNYERASDQRLQEWRKFVAQKKISINMENCYGTFGSPYGY